MFHILLIFLHVTAVVSDPAVREKRAAVGQNPLLVPGNAKNVGFNQGNNQNFAGRLPVGGNPNLVSPNGQKQADIIQGVINAQGNPIAFNWMNQGQPVQGAQNTNRRAPQFMLSESPECQEDLRRHCNMALGTNRHNFAVLECLQDNAEMEISDECQHLIYLYKRNSTKDGRFEHAGKEVCRKALDTYPECKNEKQENRIPCLVDYMDNINEVSCQQFLIKMASIIFSDYRYVYHFMESCEKDIDQLKCGRLDNDVDRQRDQGKTIFCLASRINILQPNCRKRVLRIAELQSDDYHLDRPLHYACRHAREVFCERVYSGGGKVFQCLFKHKSDDQMPIDCREMLTVRQQLIAEDVKIEKTFFTACRKDIKRQKCIGANVDENSDFNRADILLCLQNAMKNNSMLAPMCIQEMKQMRTSLMEDYKISPDIVVNCDNEIRHHCNNGVERGGKTLHCLINVANPRKLRDGQRISGECKAALDDLLTLADVGQNIKVDRVLMEACGEAIDLECKNNPGTKLIDCLMNKVDSDSLTDDCKDRLLEIQYFLVRDFKLESSLYKKCHKDAMEKCHASVNWVEVKVPGASYDPMIFSCLRSNMKYDKTALSSACADEVKRAMRRRAKSVDLEPEIEYYCMADLGAFCSNDVENGGEIACLQDNFEYLAEDCADAVREFTEGEEDDLELDAKLMKACTPMIKKLCGELLEHDAEASDVMDCLIENKRHYEMDKKCAASVERRQIIQLKDIKFSPKFRKACRKDIQDHCGFGGKKTEMVACLSEVVRSHILQEKEKTRISADCLQQLRVEVLRRGETIQLDPELKRCCVSDIQQFCSSVQAGTSRVIQCLKDNKSRLSNACHVLIFKRQLDEAMLGADFLLFRICKPMIKTFCKTKYDAVEEVDCLKRNRNVPFFDSKCRALLMKKVLEETKDFRLNPNLAKNCTMDIRKFCSDIVSSNLGRTNEKEFEGQVLNCLKMQYAKKMLSRDCNTEIRTLVMESHMDIDMDPVLMYKCQKEIQHFCKDEMETHKREKGASARMRFQPQSTGDRVEECLQEKFEKRKFPRESECGREVVRLIEEVHVDVNNDPQLRIACQNDLNRYCQDTDIGEGRQMSCLLGALEGFPNKLMIYCKKLLTKHRALWEYAAKAAPAESLSDLADNVVKPPPKSYLMAVLMTIFGDDLIVF